MNKKVLLGALALALAGAFFLGDPKEWLNIAIAVVEKLGFWGPLVFALTYILAAVALAPGSALTLSAGALFGVVQGSIIVSIASNAAAGVSQFLRRRAWLLRTLKSTDQWANKPQSLFVRRALFRALGGFPDGPILEDVE